MVLRSDVLLAKTFFAAEFAMRNNQFGTKNLVPRLLDFGSAYSALFHNLFHNSCQSVYANIRPWRIGPQLRDE